jgi:hypothetical protein
MKEIKLYLKDTAENATLMDRARDHMLPVLNLKIVLLLDLILLCLLY